MSVLDLGLSPADVAYSRRDDRYTPRWVFDAAGLVFDLDVAAPADPSRRVCPARRYLTILDDGLTTPWHGMVWMNPPFSNTAPWAAKWAAHRNGLALVPALKQTSWLGGLLGAADAVALVSADFTSPVDKDAGSVPFVCVLAACGPVSVAALARVAEADRYANGVLLYRSPIQARAV